MAFYNVKIVAALQIKTDLPMGKLLTEAKLSCKCYYSQLTGLYYLGYDIDNVPVTDISLRDLVDGGTELLKKISENQELRTFLVEKIKVQGQVKNDVFLLDRANMDVIHNPNIVSETNS